MMAKYVLYLNSIIRLDEITEEERVFISNYYEVLFNFKQNDNIIESLFISLLSVNV